MLIVRPVARAPATSAITIWPVIVSTKIVGEADQRLSVAPEASEILYLIETKTITT